MKEKSDIFMPTRISSEDDIKFLMKRSNIKIKELEIIAFALRESIVQSGAHQEDLKRTLKNVYQALSCEHSILSSDAKYLAKIALKGRAVGKALFVLSQAVKSERERKEEDENLAKYFDKLQTNKNFEEWAKSAFERSDKKSFSLLESFTLNSESKIAFVSKDRKMHFVLHFPAIKDQTERKAAFLKAALLETRLFEIINGNFQIFELL